MDMNPQDVVPVEPDDAPDRRASGPTPRSQRLLNASVAITVALLATFMGICKVKDDNIVQAMQQAQADKIDHWSFYQARNIRQDVAEANATQLRLARIGRAPAEAAAYDAPIAHAEAVVATEQKKKQEVRAQAEQDQKTYDDLNYRDDQFDLSDALLAISISLLAVTALTRLWWLYFVAWVPIFFGVLMGLAGLAGWAIHPTALVKLLS